MEDETKLERNHCQTIKTLEDGTQEIKQKKVFETHDDAVMFAKKIMLQKKIKEKLVAYKCSVCHKYHIGRNGKPITEKYRAKLKEQLEYMKKSQKVKNIKFKVVGKIDLNNIK